MHRGPERLALSRRFAVSLSIGVDFREAPYRSGQRLRYFVVVIGEQWLTISSNTGVRRLDDPRGVQAQ